MNISQFKDLTHSYFSAAIQQETHPFFSDLAKNTIKNYRIGSLRLNEAATITADVDDYSLEFSPARAQAIANYIVDKYGPGSARVSVSTMGSILSFKLLYTDMGMDTFNPFDRVKLPALGVIEPWTDAQIEEHLQSKSFFLKNLVSILLETAQRLSDVTTLTAEDLMQPGQITLTQKKTGTRVSIPKTEKLLAVISSIVSACGHHTNNIWTFSSDRIDVPSEDSLRGLYAKTCFSHGIEPQRLHGLRKNAVLRMIAAGATEFEIMAVTGHKSTSSLRHYTADYNRDAAAREAVKKLEAYTHGK